MTEAGTEAPSVDARHQEVAARFGHRLTDEQLTQVRRRIERAVRLSEAMKVTPVTNSDEPEIVFAPYRADS